MQNKNNIEKLLDKYISEGVTDSEKQLLFDIFNTPENKKFINSWLKKNWKELKDEDLSVAIDSGELLKRIHQQIDKERYLAISNRKTSVSKIKRISKIGLRYAAVCLVACGFEWYILTQQPKKQAISQQYYNEITVPHGSKSCITMADSTKVWLNAGAKFSYPTNFEDKSREVFLEGEAYFEVKKDKHRPFFVKMNGMNIKVLGTKFNVSAYADDPRIETTLLEGSIEVVGLRSNQDSDKDLFLKPGQKLVLFKENKKVTPPSIAQNDVVNNALSDSVVPVKIKSAELITLANSDTEVAWRKDKLMFDKQRFDEVKTKLERWYGVTIDVHDSTILNYRFTGSFDKETFEQAMKALQEAARFEYVLNKKHVIIKKSI